MSRRSFVLVRQPESVALLLPSAVWYSSRTRNAGAHCIPRRRGADRALSVGGRSVIFAAAVRAPLAGAGICSVLITNHTRTHVPAQVGSRATGSRACSGSLCICRPACCNEDCASNHGKTDFAHDVSSLVEREQISMPAF